MRHIFLVLAVLALLMVSALPAVAMDNDNNDWGHDKDWNHSSNWGHDNDWGHDNNWDNDWDHGWNNWWWGPSNVSCSWFPSWWGWSLWCWSPWWGWWQNCDSNLASLP